MGHTAIKMAKQKDETERRCIVTAERAPKHGLIRFVLGPDRQIVPDLAEKLPGRGFWVSADADVLARAVAKGAFARAARGPVDVPDTLLADVVGLLSARCRNLIGLARRSDQVVVGYDRVLEQLSEGAGVLVLIATDAGGGRRDVRGAAHRIVVSEALLASELSDAVGKGAASFVLVKRGGLAEKLKRECVRLEGLRPTAMGAKVDG
jgi:predicted RNA-binding protein YlxR (DUF448 family)/ribosomal protein L7Ae-like RNA K-turn-binding protein